MKLNSALTRIGAIAGSLGLASLLNLNAVLTWLFHTLKLPESSLQTILALPGPLKGVVVVALVAYALYTTWAASSHNPDGTPAVEPYKPEIQ